MLVRDQGRVDVLSEQSPDHPPTIGVLAAAAGRAFPLAVCKSAAGYYLGTYDEGVPFSRESQQYWTTAATAQVALTTGAWTQRLAP